jgi:hypothetical protein
MPGPVPGVDVSAETPFRRGAASPGVAVTIGGISGRGVGALTRGASCERVSAGAGAGAGDGDGDGGCCPFDAIAAPEVDGNGNVDRNGGGDGKDSRGPAAPPGDNTSTCPTVSR